MTTTPPDARNALAEIVAGLDGVTPGFPRWIRLFGERTVYTRDPNDGCRIAAVVRADATYSNEILDHIARCDPATMRSIADYVAALEAQVEGMRVALENLATVIKDNKRGVLHSLSRRETDILTQALHDARAALQSSETTGEK